MQKIFNPSPKDHKNPGFAPNMYFRFLRAIAKCIKVVFFLNGANRFSNEFIQMLSPKCRVKISDSESLTFRTGHGRLYWRAKSLLKEEPMMIRWLDDFSSDEVFYDIGANVGCYSLYAAKRGAKVYSFEADMNNVSVLFENIFLNKLNTLCMPVPLPLGVETRVEKMYLRDFSRSGDAMQSIGRKNSLLENNSVDYFDIDSLVMRLDDIVAQFKLPLPTKMKIDVDGNELLVLRGASLVLKNVRELYIEIDRSSEEHQQIPELLKAYSLKLASEEPLPVSWEGHKLSNCLFKREG